MAYYWDFVIEACAHRLTAVEGNRYAYVFLDPCPPSGWHHLHNVAMALKSTTKALMA